MKAICMVNDIEMGIQKLQVMEFLCYRLDL